MTESTERKQAVLARDPEPVSISLTIFAAITGGIGVAIQAAERRRGLRQDRDTARTKLLTADRALNRLDEAYRSLISVFDESGLLTSNTPFVPGRAPLFVDRALKGEINRIRRNAFEAGRILEQALDELSPHLEDDEAARANRLAYSVERHFRDAQSATQLPDFLWSVGVLLKELSVFLESVAGELGVQLSSSRLQLLDEALARLEMLRPRN